MEQQSSTSKVTVEYFDPHDVYKLLSPGLTPRLPLRNLHWQSHAGPLRSIDTLHVELVQGGDAPPTATPTPSLQSDGASRDDGFQTQNMGGRAGSTDAVDAQSLPVKAAGSQRRHQIPGLRRTPYLKVLLVRCDDNESYKSTVRSEIREWIKTHAPPPSSSKKGSKEEKHDAFEWLIVHVVIPNTAASTQPRSSSKTDGAAQEKSATSRWRTGTTPLMEKLRSDFNGTSKGSPDRIAQIRIGINDVPYDMLPRVVPAVPSGYLEAEQDATNAWAELVGKLTSLILSSFDMRVTQYEEDIKEKDGQRTLPGWNFCTFFILKEGLARGFENVGLVEDALVGYDELSVGLDSVIHEQAEMGSPESHGGAMLSYTEELKKVAEKALSQASGGDGEDEEAVDLQSKETSKDQFDEIPISSTKKAYRDMILANKVSVFDFRCYIFSRQMSLLLRLGNAFFTREELLKKLKHQEESNLHGVSPLATPTRHEDESENLAMMAEVCRRTLQFVPSVSHIMRQDIIAAIRNESSEEEQSAPLDPLLEETVENLVATFAFSVAQQILAQTSTKALPIPPSSLFSGDGQEPKSSIPEPKTMMHPARTSSLYGQPSPRPPPSPGVFPGPGRRASVAANETQSNHFLKAGIEQLAAKRAELYMLSRSILDGLGKKRGWSTGWDEAPMMGDTGIDDMEEVSLDDDSAALPASGNGVGRTAVSSSLAGIDNHLLRVAMDNVDDFYKLFEILTDKALRHYTVANHDHAVQANRADLAVLKFHMKQYREAAFDFLKATPFFGGEGWSLLELSMLVMYARCLGELQSKEEYVTVALTLLTKACAAERDRLEAKSSLLLGASRKAIPDMSPIQGVVGKLFSLAAGLPSEVKVPLANFFTNVDMVGTPEYQDNRDSCSISISLRSLLPEEVTLNGIELRVSCPDGGPRKELVFEKKGEVVLTPGKNVVRVDCNSAVPGTYNISYLGLLSSNMCLHFERDSNHSSPLPDIFKNSDVTLFQRTGALDVQLRASKHTTLDKDNSLDLELSTGWNDLESCELRIKPGTGGLRLLTTKAEIVDSSGEFAKQPETGAFFFGAMDVDKSVKIRFPYSVEQDVGDVSAKVEVTYVTKSGETFYLAKSLAVSVYLALGVSVQDVFKHNTLFSRFNVSSVTQSPLRLYKSELLESDHFESAFGIPPASTVLVFPKQPASLMYKVKRKPASKATKKPGKAMHLKLHYSLLQTEVEQVVSDSVAAALKESPLVQYSKLILACVAREVKNALQAQDLERTALLGEIATAFLEDIPWAQHFRGFGILPGTNIDVATKASEILVEWQQNHRRIPMAAPSASEPSSILIPVEIPSISIVHTADIRLEKPIHSPVEGGANGGAPTVCVNQMLPATLHLKWTRMWDTETAQGEDQEFSYEVTAPADTWLLGGRRKGHFVIPGDLEATSSTPETEAEIPLILIPLREGYIPYPMVEIREVKGDADASMDRTDSADADESGSRSCEVDWRNLGETVRVIGERSGVTLSLDASGPGGGPLVFEKERLGRHQGRMVA